MTVKQYLLFTIPLLAIAAGSAFGLFKLTEKKIGYIVIQAVFDDFDYTKEVRSKITSEQQVGIRIIDSLKNTIKTEDDAAVNKEKMDRMVMLRDELMERNKTITADYNAKIWMKLNKYINDFGEQKKYQLLLGAEGSGAVMYADSSLNVTREAIEFINKRYADVTEK